MKHPRSCCSKVMSVLSWKGKDISKGFSVCAHFPECLIMVLDYEHPLEPVSQSVPLVHVRNHSGVIEFSALRHRPRELSGRCWRRTRRSGPCRAFYQRLTEVRAPGDGTSGGEEDIRGSRKRKGWKRWLLIKLACVGV